MATSLTLLALLCRMGLATATRSLLAGRTGSDPMATWRYTSYAKNQYVLTNKRDGLPDYSFFDNAGTDYTSTSIACPAALQQLTCYGKMDKGKCCAKAGNGTRRHVYAKIYCNAQHSEIEKLAPEMAGNTTSADKRTTAPRTRRNILERAVGWVAMHMPYMGCGTSDNKYSTIETCAKDDPAECPAYTHTASCEGMITMAFGTPERGAHEHRIFIPCSELQPGDAIREVDKNGKSPHVTMFREFDDPKNISAGYRGFQMGGGHNAANMFAKPPGYKFCDFNTTTKKSCLECYKYSNITDEATDLSIREAAADEAAPVAVAYY